jgi:oligopeptide/dipeptide ABC transporter ATP-binding protein
MLGGGDLIPVATQPLLSVRELSVAFAEADGTLIRAADGVSFDVPPAGALGLVGESGCGKSATLRSLIGLHHPGRILSGQVFLNGEDIVGVSKDALNAVRGSKVAMIFQDASSALDPVLSIGAQLIEVLKVKRGMHRKPAERAATALLERVGIPSAARRMRAYPHELSGGMRQRVMIAMAIAPKPSLLLADEPTTALDVTVQDQVLSLLSELRQEEQMAMVLVSHDLGIVAQECDYVAVMYAGRIVEYGTIPDVLDAPRHPYTEALLDSTLPTQPASVRTLLHSIRGQPPELADLPAGCPFVPRCDYAQEQCKSASMALDRRIPEHGSACLFPERVKR